MCHAPKTSTRHAPAGQTAGVCPAGRGVVRGVSRPLVSKLRGDTSNDYQYEPRTFIHPKTGQPTSMNTANIGQRPSEPASPIPALFPDALSDISDEDDEEWTEQAEYEYDLAEAKAAGGRPGLRWSAAYSP